MKKAVRERIDGRSPDKLAAKKEQARRDKIHREELRIARAAQREMDAQSKQSRNAAGVLEEVGVPGTRFPLDPAATARMPRGAVRGAEMTAGLALHNGEPLPGYVMPLLGDAFEWTIEADHAARLAAEGMPPMMICERVGIHFHVFEQWMLNADFRLRIRQYLENLAEDVMTSGLANRTHRLMAANDRWNAQKTLVAKRAAAAKDNPDSLPGADTGWLNGKGEYDATLAGAMLDHEKQAAIEVGQWNEGPQAISKIEIVYADKQLIVHHDEQ